MAFISTARVLLIFLAAPLLLAGPAFAQDKKRVVEEIVARVNNEVITLSDLTRGRTQLAAEIEDECRRTSCKPEERESQLREREKNLLNDMIDQLLLVQRAKDAGINVESDLIKRMDQIRQQNNLATMEDLERAVNNSGISFEDWKNNMRNGLLTQETIRREVGGRMDIGDDEIKKYYEEHKDEFVRPERVFLSEIFVSTDGKPESEISALEEKARKLLDRVRKGEDFNELAKRLSDGSTAQQGGDLGGDGFARSELDKEIGDIVFKMERREVTDVIRTKTGFLILKVEQRFEAGLQPIEKVSGEIQSRIYYQKLRPALKDYLKTLREESYVQVKPGYADPSLVASSSPITEVEPAPLEEEEKKKKRRKWFIIF